MNLYFDLKKERKQLPFIIDEILNDPIKLKSVAKASYHHALGFDKMVLKENYETTDKLCLHFWWPNAPDGDDNIHPHRWHFNSLVLIGEIKVEQYELNSSGQLFHQYTYFSPEQNEHYELTPCGTNNVILTREFNLRAGSSYSQEYSQLHRVTRKNPFVVTFFTQSPAVIGYTKILSKLPIPESLLKISTIRMKEEYVIECLTLLQNKYLKAPNILPEEV